ncbi:hypothetical protein RHSIM_Rhsim11G0107900 [Rhododendron simsii]|uniref:Uncharacterized protein n=1 Tax=Rhododendron simsii TaxID=118357 RepID=A0A834GAH3_RHOSS|nr:hypothetical protein RHSIM_RhsimUnG0088500 [Rhododendron simsii]KAF7127716.1 hypothetical protein RHSIM_Rhsim11G0107900 [Rhododendron simsii]
MLGMVCGWWQRRLVAVVGLRSIGGPGGGDVSFGSLEAGMLSSLSKGVARQEVNLVSLDIIALYLSADLASFRAHGMEVDKRKLVVKLAYYTQNGSKERVLKTHSSVLQGDTARKETEEGLKCSDQRSRKLRNGANCRNEKRPPPADLEEENVVQRRDLTTAVGREGRGMNGKRGKTGKIRMSSGKAGEKEKSSRFACDSRRRRCRREEGWG